MKVLSEDYGYSLIFKDEKDLDTTATLLRDGLNGFKKDKIKPPYIITFYSADGVTPEFIAKEAAKLKKALKNGK
jgi:hypothetical protein